MLIFYVAQFAVGIFLQNVLADKHKGTFSLENYYCVPKSAKIDENDAKIGTEKLNFHNILMILIVSPLEEELLFHGFIFYILVRRTKNIIWSVIISNLFFGGYHLLNLLSSVYPLSYILFQVIFGAMMGIVYTLRFLLALSFWENYTLHILNNVFASFLSPSKTFTIDNPIILFSVVSTAMIYSYLLYKNLGQVKKLYPTNSSNKTNKIN